MYVCMYVRGSVLTQIFQPPNEQNVCICTRDVTIWVDAILRIAFECIAILQCPIY